jgi:hypothetical protein
MFDKKLVEFMEENKNITMVSFAWSLFWRIYTMILAICIGLAILGEIFS